MPALHQRLNFARDLAQQAGALALRLRPPPGAAQGTLKARQDWLTEADGAVERFISERVHDRFPQDGFQGEEAGRTREGTLCWVVDPIDGTSNFARGGTRWCVSIGLLAETAPVLGVLFAPARRELYAGLQSFGATLNGAPLRSADTTDLNRAIIEAGWSSRIDNIAYLDLCARIVGTGAMLRSGGSGALGLAEVAAGRLDAYTELHINVWDCAAALAILAEAGALTNAFLPASLTTGGPILAAAPGVAATLSALARLPLGGPRQQVPDPDRTQA